MHREYTRRQVLIGAAAALAALAMSPVTSGAAPDGYSGKPGTLRNATMEGTMAKNVLIAYATRCGSTRTVAERMAAILRSGGATVDVLDAKKCKSVAGYDAVIVGSGIRMGKVYGEATRLVKRNRESLASARTAFFSVSMGAKETDAETVAKVGGYLDGLEGLVEPAASADFAGAFAIDTLGPIFRWTMSKAAESDDAMQEGEFYDWDAIEAWATAFAG